MAKSKTLISDFTRKKTLSLFKAYLVPVATGQPEGWLSINVNNDRYGLTEKAAATLAIQEACATKDLNNLIKDNKLDLDLDEFIALVEVKIPASNKPILVDGNGTEIDPDYNGKMDLVSATLLNQEYKMKCSSFMIQDIKLNIGRDNGIVEVTKLNLQPISMDGKDTGYNPEAEFGPDDISDDDEDDIDDIDTDEDDTDDDE